MKSNTELFAIAKRQLGKGGSTFRKYVGLSSGQPWCDAFVYWLFNANGCGALLPWKGRQRFYCPASIQWCEKNLAQIPLYLALPCDIIYFDWEPNGTPNHIGIVYNKIDTNKIHTLEGNTSGGIVDDKIRTATYVQAVFRPHFKGTFKLGIIAVDGECGYSTIANLQRALKMSFNDGILGKATVKALQKKAGLTGKAVDGAWGPATSRAVQKLTGLTGKAIDGEFGPASVRSLQAWINKQNGAKPVTPTPAPKPAPTPTKSTYTGAFPDLVVHSGQKIAETAKALAYPKGTNKATYTYPKGKATAAFTAAINRVFPKRSTWSKQCQAGASCDVGAATVIRASGIDPKIPRGLEEQIPYLEKSNRFKKTDLKKTSEMKPGDVGVYIGKTKGAHIWIGLGGGLIAEANHTAKFFEHIDTDNYTSSGKKTWGIYRACIPSAIGSGDKGSEVTKLQRFLNWFGGYGLAIDVEAGPKTVAAIKSFQSLVQITADGWFGSASLTMAKKCSPSKSTVNAVQTKPLVDVSWWQHSIDWGKAAAEISGAILRASYTTQNGFSLAKDSTFATNLAGAVAHGLPVGAYHYSQAISVEEARKEAAFICNILAKNKNMITLPVVIDWEFGGRLNSSVAKKLGRAKCTEIIEAFCKVVISYGFTPMVYANYSTFSSYLDAAALKTKYKIWLAQYASKPSMSCDYWQYTSSGSVKGINGRVDMNRRLK